MRQTRGLQLSREGAEGTMIRGRFYELRGPFAPPMETHEPSYAPSIRTLPHIPFLPSPPTHVVGRAGVRPRGCETIDDASETFLGRHHKGSATILK